ncbi:MAG: DUF4340 domain-containing protein [Anaerolineaceae bacterium]|nr:DUF4340 domain-containing protein [Anaerolineaceae bacterium]
MRKFDWFDQIESDRKTVTPTQSFWLDIQLPQISKVTFTMDGMDDVIIQKMSETDWIINNGSVSITPGKIEELVAELNAIQPLLILADVPESTATGLNNPEIILIFELNDSTLISLNIGSLNPLQTGYYAQNDLKEVVLISKGSVDNIVNMFTVAFSAPLQENGS